MICSFHAAGRWAAGLLALLTGAAALGQGVTVADNPMDVDVEEYLEKISLPEGFAISLFATDVPRARSLAVANDGVVYVGSRGNSGGRPVGKVYALVDRDGDFKADQVITIAEGLNSPNGVALKDGDLYVAEISRILRFDKIGERLDNPPEPVVVTDDYPTATHHGWKFIAFGPDGKLYVPVGAPCNTCESEDIFATITRIDPDGGNREIFARGIRNSVGFDWHPETGELWFTENGRDLMGNKIPPDELNRAPKPGLHFGFPYYYGTSIKDPTFQTDRDPESFTKPVVEFPAHNAPLGMRFYTGDSFPEEYHNDVFVALHGSWNRSPPSGYQLRRIDLDGNQVKDQQVFASGWLIDDQYWGRPVDVAVMKDGSLLVSDDHANVVYRIRYTGE